MTTAQVAYPLTSRLWAVTAGDINIWHARLLADQQITYVLDFDGRLDPGRLRLALAVLKNALPLLSQVWHVQGRRLSRAPLLDAHHGLTIADDTCEPPSALERFISLPTDPEHEPPLKLFLLRHAARDTLVVKVDHLLTDAAGLKHLLGLLAEAYSTGEVHQTTNPDRGFGQVLSQFSLPALFRAARHASVPRPASGLMAGPFQPGGLFLEHACLEPELFSRLRLAAKARGATINDALVAAVFHAVFQWLGPGAPAYPLPAYPLMVPVDMRRYLPEGRRGVVGNLSSALYPILAPCPGECIHDLLGRLQAILEPLKRDDPGLGPMLLMALGALWGGELIRRRYTTAAHGSARYINVTNFGIMDRAQVAFDGAPLAQVYGVGPLQNAPGLVLALSTYADTLHLVVQSNDASRFQPFVRAFLRDVLGGVQQLAE